MPSYSAEDIARLRDAKIIRGLEFSSTLEIFSEPGRRDIVHDMTVVTAQLTTIPLRATFDPTAVGAESRVYEEFTGDDSGEITPSWDQVVNEALATAVRKAPQPFSNHLRLLIENALNNP